MHHINVSNNLVTLTLRGEVRSEDYADMVPKFEELTEKRGRLRLLVFVEDIEGLEPEAVWRDLKFDAKHLNDFERVAVVGDASWQAWSTWLGKAFTSAEVRFFEAQERERARAWVTA